MQNLDNERQEKLYASGKYLENSPDWSEGESGEKSKGAAALLKSVGLNQLTSILDVGCGTGGLLEGLLDYDLGIKRALGIDMAMDAIRLGKSLRKSNIIELRTASLADINEKFDLVIASHVVEHVPEYRQFLNDLSERGKYIYINIPIEINVLYALRSNVLDHQFHTYGHLHFYTERFFDAFVIANGFKIKARGYGTEIRAQSKNGLSGFVIYIMRECIGLFSKPLATRLLGGFTYQLIIERT